MYYIKVKASHRWTSAQVSGRIFSKHGGLYNPAIVNDEILNSPLLDVEFIEPDPEPAEIDATDSARELAEAHGVDLGKVAGTGEAGRILKKDVEAYIAEVGQ